MSDRELLTLAAKAAGIVVVPYTWNKGSPWGEHEGFTVVGEGANEWNPLEDDGDALRLAVMLGLALVPYPIYGNPKHSVIAKRYDHARYLRDEAEEPQIEEVQVYGGDPAAATRRAIVRAAAEIGRQTP